MYHKVIENLGNLSSYLQAKQHRASKNGYSETTRSNLNKIRNDIRHPITGIIVLFAINITILFTTAPIAAALMLTGSLLFNNETRQLITASSMALFDFVTTIPVFAAEAFQFLKAKIQSVTDKKPVSRPEEMDSNSAEAVVDIQPAPKNEPTCFQSIVAMLPRYKSKPASSQLNNEDNNELQLSSSRYDARDPKNSSPQ